MNKTKALFHFGVGVLVAILVAHPAFSEPDKGAAGVTKLVTIDNKVGAGTEAVTGKSVDVHYTGWIYSPVAPNHKGKKFDSSLDRGSLFSFPLGAGRVIKGWDQGVVGMKVGGMRTLIVPADMGYGERGAGGVIPPNAALVFDVELFSVK